MVKRFTLCFVLFFLTAVLRAEGLSLTFFNRPPYYHMERNAPSGFLLIRALRIMEAAGIPYTLHELPSSRITAIIQSDSERMVSVGWFKNPERELYSRFSLPIYRNKPEVVLTLASRAADLERAGSFANLAGMKPYTLGVISGFSYGQYIDARLTDMGARRISVNAMASQLVEMLAAGRFDYILADPEEVSYLIAQARLTEDLFATIGFCDIPEGNLRYLWCSNSVTPEELARIDAAILKLYPEVR